MVLISLLLAYVYAVIIAVYLERDGLVLQYQYHFVEHIFNNYPPFDPGTLCSLANCDQLIGFSLGYSLGSAITFSLSHSTFSKFGEWDFCRFGAGGFSNDCESLLCW